MWFLPLFIQKMRWTEGLFRKKTTFAYMRTWLGLDQGILGVHIILWRKKTHYSSFVICLGYRSLLFYLCSMWVYMYYCFKFAIFGWHWNHASPESWGSLFNRESWCIQMHGTFWCLSKSPGMFVRGSLRTSIVYSLFFFLVLSDNLIINSWLQNNYNLMDILFGCLSDFHRCFINYSFLMLTINNYSNLSMLHFKIID